MLAGEQQPEAEQRTVEYALSDITQEIHERQIKEQHQILDQVGWPVQLFDFQMMIPEQCGK